jgi:hypothetical protein
MDSKGFIRDHLQTQITKPRRGGRGPPFGETLY